MSHYDHDDSATLELDRVLAKDRIKTSEINILTRENRAQAARIEQLTAALIAAAHDITPPADNLACHVGLTSTENCSRCARAKLIYAALEDSPHAT